MLASRAAGSVRADPQPAQPGGHLVGAPRHLRERHLLLGTVLLDDPQRGAVIAVADAPAGAAPAGDNVEPVGGPVELSGQFGPLEGGHGLVVVGDEVDELVARGAISVRVRHG